jgi:hypothetical protein
MTDIMAQQSMLSAPASRQDIVSALLNDYGNSFGRGDASPSTYSPVPADKELPAPPPRSDSIARKPLPAALRMDAKFQLRGKQEFFRLSDRWDMFTGSYQSFVRTYAFVSYLERHYRCAVLH